MKKIYKYVLAITDEQILGLPSNSKILSVKEQNSEIVLYALIDDEAKGGEGYSIIVLGTGHYANGIEKYNFLGTVKLLSGSLMFHVFYLKQEVK